MADPPWYNHYDSSYTGLQQDLLQELGQPTEEPLQNQLQYQHQKSQSQQVTASQQAAEEKQGAVKVQWQSGQDELHDHQMKVSCQHFSSLSSEARKISCEDIQRVQNFVEACIKMYMNQDEVVKTLSNRENVEPCFTRLVWQKLEEQNADFFKAYYTRLKLKEQILLFNHLLEQQCQLMVMETALPPLSYVSSKNLMRADPNFQQPQLLINNQPHLVSSMNGDPATLLTQQNPFLSQGSVGTENKAFIEVASMEQSSLFDALSMSNLAFSPASTVTSSQPFSSNPPMSLSIPFTTSSMAGPNGIGSLHMAPDILGDIPGSLEHFSLNLSTSDLTTEFTNNQGNCSGSTFLTPSMDAFLSTPFQNTREDRTFGSITEPGYDSYEDKGLHNYTHIVHSRQ